jgi:hypothetical protein
MKRIAMLLALAGCVFAQKHPAITAGIVGGSIGFVTCQINVEDKPGTCALVGAGAGTFLALVVAIATAFTDTEDHTLPKLDELPPEPIDAYAYDAVPDAAVAVPADAVVTDSP